ncbi:hypothetical protein [Moorena producens]|uniref:hypothetical protein n=1 Tax=Moorena producens TaxID=1155739 RepID=UPI003C7234E5
MLSSFDENPLLSEFPAIWEISDSGKARPLAVGHAKGERDRVTLSNGRELSKISAISDDHDSALFINAQELWKIPAILEIMIALV